METARQWRATAAGLAAGACAAGLLQAWPASDIEVFARGAASLAGLFTGAPVWRVAEGWMLPAHDVPAVVTRACSGADFFVLVSALIGWRIAASRRFAGRDGSPSRPRTPRRGVPTVAALLVGIAAALPVAIAVNAVRIVCVTAAHRWIIPHLPDAYGAFAHMAAGVAVFLPALIGLNLLFENHERHTAEPGPS